MLRRAIADVDMNDPRMILAYGRHFSLLAGVAIVLAVTARWHPPLGTVSWFGIYGGLHACTVVLTLRSRQTVGRKLSFILIAAALCALAVLAGFAAVRLLAAVPGAGVRVVFVSLAGLGAMNYAMLIRGFWMPALPLRAVVSIGLVCALATLVTLPLGISLLAGGMGFAVMWWCAFSAALGYYDRDAGD
jgi:hypothetical protein